ncbi:MAG: O-antigen ligase family protein [Pirellulaceae bacterium]|nr:O-antigen ligase family protein [Pirellulaceae bacterium]
MVSRSEQCVSGVPVPQPTCVILAVWCLAFLTFDMPDRMAPASIGSLDLLALAKLLTRVTFLAIFGWMVVSFLKFPRTQKLVGLYLPLWLFVGWAFISTLWSPLRTITLGQSLGQLLLLLMSICVALSCYRQRNESKILFQLCLVLSAFSFCVVSLHYVFPQWASLSREEYEGLFHPTNVASAASTGILLVLGCSMGLKLVWAQRLVWFAVPVHFVALLLSVNRLSLGLVAILVLAMLIVYGGRVGVAALALAGCVLLTCLLVVDPGLKTGDSLVNATGGYASRGQSFEQMAALSGRDEMWRAIWNSYLESPLIGHGYFVCSSTGMLDVWHSYSNFTAHNLVLQALVSVGIVGLLLFFWWVFRLFRLALFPGIGKDHRYFAIFIPLACYLFFWSILNASYLGPIRPENIIVACLVGVFINRVLLNEEENHNHDRNTE